MRRATGVSSAFRPHWARPRLSWPVSKVDVESTRSIDRNGHPGRARPPSTAADGEEVGPVHVDDPRELLGPVVVDDAIDTSAGAADDDDRAARQSHGRRAVVVEGRVTADLVARGLPAPGHRHGGYRCGLALG